MDQQLCQIELIRRARSGDRQCLDQLAQQARERLLTYVYRLTQQEDLAQEIVQESLFEMCKVIGKLKKADRFWPWLYGIAINKLRRYYRTEQTQRKLAISSLKHNKKLTDRQEGLENLVGEELKHIVSSAMRKLRDRHKAVLIMRCYDEMAYSDIAESMGCSEFSTRMLFLRAKKALQKELSRNGFGKGSLLAALMLFGKMTAPSEAAAAQVSVTAAATKVGLLAGIAGLATTKTAVISFTAAGALTAGMIITTSRPWLKEPESISPVIGNSQSIGQFGQDSNNREEYWYYFPQGPSGTLMLRVKSGIVGDGDYWQVLQNGHSNYYYRGNSVQINNHRMWASDLSVLRLPTDDRGLTDFLSQVEANPKPVDHVSASGKGLLVIAAQNEVENGNRSWAMRHFNVLEEDYFQSDWPSTVRIDNNCDAMHKRGWTYFRVAGQINGQNVLGAGRIPFVYLTSGRYNPWIKLQVGSLTVVDTQKEAYVYRSTSSKLGLYKGGSFFKGLTRPWMGLHTIDTVRRDAAEKRVWFETKHTSGSKSAQVELILKNSRILYQIDLDTDVIDEITFYTNDGETGNLKFTYLQSIDGAGSEFSPPTKPGYQAVPKGSQGLLWLVQLMEGSLE